MGCPSSRGVKALTAFWLAWPSTRCRLTVGLDLNLFYRAAATVCQYPTKDVAGTESIDSQSDCDCRTTFGHCSQLSDSDQTSFCSRGIQRGFIGDKISGQQTDTDTNQPTNQRRLHQMRCGALSHTRIRGAERARQQELGGVTCF